MSDRGVPEQMMRYLDGELPPDERRAFEEAAAKSSELQRELALYRAMHLGFQELSFMPPPQGTSVWDRISRQLLQPVGWALFIVGAVVWVGYGAYLFMVSPVDIIEKMSVSGIAIGLILLLAGVIREQYRAYGDDRYRNVHR